MQSQYLVRKLEIAIFYLLIFTIPVQARVILHKWTEPFNQWTSAYLYGTDLLIGALFFCWAIRCWRGERKVSRISYLVSSIKNQIQNTKYKILNTSSFWLAMFFVVSALSIFNSQITGLSFYQLLKLTEFIGFYFYLKSNFGKIFQFRTVLAVIIASGLFQSIIAIAQYLKQGSIGLRLLGESPLSVNTTGVAVFFADSEKYLRAYGTVPHPNILAAWLFVAIFALYFLFLHQPIKNKDEKSLLSFLHDRNKMIVVFFWKYSSLLIYAILLFAFFFTFSRVIIGLWILGVLARLLTVVLKKDFRSNLILKRKMLNLFAASVIIAAVFSLIYWPQVSSRINISAQEEAVTQRVFYNKIAESTVVSNPLLGVGIGQFIPNFMSKFKHLPPSVYQPVHNLYLLIASETGFLGLAAFLLFVFFSIWQFLNRADFKKLYTFSFLIFTSSFLVVGLFDHFLWTSQQGNFIFWMVLSLLSVNGHKN